jgi:hypothetical protein
MGKYIAGVLLGLVIGSPALAQENYDDTVAVVKSWYRHFLKRQAEPTGLQGWVESYRANEDPDAVLSNFLGQNEYYAKAGSTRRGLVRRLFADVLGRRPTSREMRYWTERLENNTNQEMIYAFLKRYPRRR